MKTKTRRICNPDCSISDCRGSSFASLATKTGISFTMFFILTVAFAVSAMNVEAFGIKHTQTEIYFDTTKHYEGEFWVVNEDNEEMVLNVNVEGPLADYVTLESSTIKMSSTDYIKAIKFGVNLPESMPPGKTTTYVAVSRKFNPDKKNIVESKVSLKHAIIVYGPLPDKYVKAKINFRENEDDVELISEVKNLGNKPVSSVKTSFMINGIEQKDPLETNETCLDVGETRILKAELEKNRFTKGEYQVSAVTTYDGFQTETTKSLIIGRPEVDIVYFTKYFIYNQINKYSMDLENRWNQQIENVYVDVNVLKDNETIDSFRTPSVDIQGLMTKRISDYFDATGKPEGEYAFDMIVHFWNTYKMDKKRFYSKIISDKSKIDNGHAGYESTSWSSMALYYNLLILLLVAAGLGYIIFRIRRR